MSKTASLDGSANCLTLAGAAGHPTTPILPLGDCPTFFWLLPSACQQKRWLGHQIKFLLFVPLQHSHAAAKAASVPWPAGSSMPPGR